MIPKRLKGLYCFDLLQIRYVAKLVHDDPIKDSIISEQKGEIIDLNKRLFLKDQVIESKNLIIKNDSLIIVKLERAVDIEREASDLKVSQEKHKSKKVKLIAIGEGLIILLILIVK